MRLSIFIFYLVSSIYCLLAYIPFTYTNFIQFKLIPVLWKFAEFHHYLFLPVAGASIYFFKEIPKQKKSFLFYVICLVFAGSSLYVLFNPILINIGNNTSSLYFSFFFLFPIILFGSYDIIKNKNLFKRRGFNSAEDSIFFFSLLYSAAAMSIFFVMVFFIRYLKIQGVEIQTKIFAYFITASFTIHCCFFLLSYLLIFTFRRIIALATDLIVYEFLFYLLLLFIVISLLLIRLYLPALSYFEISAFLYCFSAAFACAVFYGGTAVKLDSDLGNNNSAFQIFASPVKYIFSRKSKLCIPMVIIYPCLIFTALFYVSQFDWNFLGQKTITFFSWLLTFIIFQSFIPELSYKKNYTIIFFIIALIFSILCKRTINTINSYKINNYDTYESLNKIANYEPSFKILFDYFFTRAARTEEAENFYQFLQKNTNIPRSIKINAFEIPFVKNIKNDNIEKPNIIIIVIDSLRRDYISAYNPRIEFTPNIKKFADENIVFTKAFTRYGATGLSEPSIWTGGMMPHQQYINPFYPLNTLQLMADKLNYIQFIGIDNVLQNIVKLSQSIIELDKNTGTQDYDLANTLEEFRLKIDSGNYQGKHFLMYTQSQNLHISVIAKHGKNIVEPGKYNDFYQPYASRVQRIDRSIGKFINYLKAQNLYNNSIIIITSDHGDSLGEDGRWGHAYNIFPEIIQIPLIIHLPENLKNTVAYNSDEVTFLVDIVPSILFLTGNNPEFINEFFGRTIFHHRNEIQAKPQIEDYLIVSSYGAVYGLLDHNAEKIYISDGVNFRDYYYNFDGTAHGKQQNFTQELTKTNQDIIRDKINKLNGYYKTPLIK